MDVQNNKEKEKIQYDGLVKTKTVLNQNQIWYKIPTTWYVKWYMYIHDAIDHKPEPLENLKENENFIIVSEEEYLFFKDHYGIHEQHLPNTLRVIKNTTHTNPKYIFEKEELNISIEKKTYLFTKNTTISEIKSTIGTSNIQLWDQINDTDVSCLDDDTKTLEDYYIFSQKITPKSKTRNVSKYNYCF